MDIPVVGPVPWVKHLERKCIQNSLLTRWFLQRSHIRGRISYQYKFATCPRQLSVGIQAGSIVAIVIAVFGGGLLNVSIGIFHQRNLELCWLTISGTGLLDGLPYRFKGEYLFTCSLRPPRVLVSVVFLGPVLIYKICNLGAFCATVDINKKHL
jgi:hypothetical protein